MLETVVKVKNIESVCDAAFNGQQAVNMIKNDVEINGYCCYQLIIIDQNMPV